VNNGAVQQSAVDIGELLIVQYALTTDERQKVEGYLSHKWGLESALPANHPYKSAAPTVGGGGSYVPLINGGLISGGLLNSGLLS